MTEILQNKSFKKTVGVLMLLLMVSSVQINRAQDSKSSPRVFLLNAKLMQQQKQKIYAAKTVDASLKQAFVKLENDAQKALKVEIASIVTKEATPPSGDKHDYMSQAPYFWKNPDTPNGLPYIRRDGERNPEIKKYPDHDLLDQMIDTVETLAIAFYFTNKEEYAHRAAEILRLWFIDEKTKMNPNLEYAQAIPGLNTGRGIGIIETRSLPRVVDAIGLLHDAKSWTSGDRNKLKAWFEKYLNWLTTSKNGRDEAAAKNNHGTFYDVQAASFALFVGKKDLAKQILENAKQKRIAAQIEPNGSQPLELERTKSWDYSVMNLEGLISLAILGESVGVDLWNYKTADGCGVRAAIEFLFQFTGDKKWSHQQIEQMKPEKLFGSVRRSALRYRDKKFLKMINAIPKLSDSSRDNLLAY